jgi:galactokinase
MTGSHASTRDDFEITVPPLVRLAQLLQEVIGGERGVRMTGGGLGGCVVALLPDSGVEVAREVVLRGYRAHDGDSARIHLCRATAAAGL